MDYQSTNSMQNRSAIKVGHHSGCNYPPKYIRGIRFSTEPVRKAINVLYGLRETVNQLALVGSFIAAVQTQMISITFPNNESPNQIAVNALFFTGLILDVVGTSLGLVNGVLFQKHILQLTHLQTSMEDMPKAVERIQLLESEGDRSPSTASLKRIKTELAELWRIEQQRVSEFNHLRPIMRMTGNAGKDEQLANLRGFLKSNIIPSLLRITFTNPICDAASSAATAVGAGVSCFVCGICVFVVDTQPFAVSFTTTFILGITIFACCAPLIILRMTNLLNHAFRKAFPLSSYNRYGNLTALIEEVFDSSGIALPYENQEIETELVVLTRSQTDEDV